MLKRLEEIKRDRGRRCKLFFVAGLIYKSNVIFFSGVKLFQADDNTAATGNEWLKGTLVFPKTSESFPAFRLRNTRLYN